MIIKPQDTILLGNSKRFRNWEAIFTDNKTCDECKKMHGKIYPFTASAYQPLHDSDRCFIIPMRTINVGDSTDEGLDGADVWLMRKGRLPDRCLSREQLLFCGLQKKRAKNAPTEQKRLFGGKIYANRRGKLPEAPFRTWYETDIKHEKRGEGFLLFSNDGLIFASYDDCQTFYEVVDC